MNLLHNATKKALRDEPILTTGWIYLHPSGGWDENEILKSIYNGLGLIHPLDQGRLGVDAVNDALKYQAAIAARAGRTFGIMVYKDSYNIDNYGFKGLTNFLKNSLNRIEVLVREVSDDLCNLDHFLEKPQPTRAELDFCKYLTNLTPLRVYCVQSHINLNARRDLLTFKKSQFNFRARALKEVSALNPTFLNINNHGYYDDTHILKSIIATYDASFTGNVTKVPDLPFAELQGKAIDFLKVEKERLAGKGLKFGIISDNHLIDSQIRLCTVVCLNQIADLVKIPIIYTGLGLQFEILEFFINQSKLDLHDTDLVKRLFGIEFMRELCRERGLDVDVISKNLLIEVA